MTGTLLAFFRPQALAKVPQRTLTFEERVLYQGAIEEIYWGHRTWPKQQLDPKPSLDAVMSQAQLERKVADYLRNSQALADYWQRPITSTIGAPAARTGHTAVWTGSEMIVWGGSDGI